MIIRPPWSPALRLDWHRGKLVNQQRLDRMIEEAEARGERASGKAFDRGLTFQCTVSRESRHEAVRRHLSVRDEYAEWAAAGFPPVALVVPRVEREGGRADR